MKTIPCDAYEQNSNDKLPAFKLQGAFIISIKQAGWSKVLERFSYDRDHYLVIFIDWKFIAEQT